MEVAVVEWADVELKEVEKKRMEEIREVSKTDHWSSNKVMEAAMDPWHHELPENAGGSYQEEARMVRLPKIYWLLLEGVGMVRNDAFGIFAVEAALRHAVCAMSREMVRELVPAMVANKSDWEKGCVEDEWSARHVRDERILALLRNANASEVAPEHPANRRTETNGTHRTNETGDGTRGTGATGWTGDEAGTTETRGTTGERTDGTERTVGTESDGDDGTGGTAAGGEWAGE